ncbi:GTP cyclohydrolase II [Buchnera aphidicola (Mindarus keteleerifoliae)]|uniref:GTP cyclohydrolase II n=1 Tax=Buchnera aphidicola TaxID=9 RepID=UPI0031B69F41
MQLKKISEANLPTPWGNFLIMGFKEKNSDKNHVALIFGDVSKNIPILSRIHSECLTGDAFFSLRCDCGFQLKKALELISLENRGILIYHRQEGRNIGLLNKIKAYSLQDNGLDTVEANQKLGFSADERDFSICIDIFNLLNIKKIKLLTNNPMKIKIFNDSGIDVIERVSIIVGKNSNNLNYLTTKEKKMGHYSK